MPPLPTPAPLPSWRGRAGERKLGEGRLQEQRGDWGGLTLVGVGPRAHPAAKAHPRAGSFPGSAGSLPLPLASGRKDPITLPFPPKPPLTVPTSLWTSSGPSIVPGRPGMGVGGSPSAHSLLQQVRGSATPTPALRALGRSKGPGHSHHQELTYPPATKLWPRSSVPVWAEQGRRLCSPESQRDVRHTRCRTRHP